jgi:tetratricopeptide (TPR) repeat protein
MAHAIESRANSAANDLRDLLDKAERQVVNLNATNIEEFLLLLDQIERMFEELVKNEMDVRPEEGRWEGLLSRISNKPGPLVSAANRVGGLPLLRQRHPPAENFWWHLDVEVTKRRVRTIRRAVVSLVALVAVVAGALWALDFFFPPDPRAVALVNTNAAIEQALMDLELPEEERWAKALEVVEDAQEALPNEPELMVWEAVLSEQLGDTGRAEAALERARQTLPDQQVALWVMVGNYRLQLNNLAGAEAAANEALALDPNDAQAHFLLGSVAEAKGDIPTAIEQFNLVFELAETDNPQLAVIARVRMGNLLQRADPFGPTGTVTETETITPAGP